MACTPIIGEVFAAEPVREPDREPDIFVTEEDIVEAQRISAPSSPSDITIGLSSLAIEPPKLEVSTSGPQTMLAILQPLANAAMLAACRNPNSRFLRMGDGTICGPSNYEYLNIRPLSAAWRLAMNQAASNLTPISDVMFDVTLPKGGESNGSGFQKVYWETTSIPPEGGIAVYTQDVMTLVITLATAVRMRSSGEVRLGLTYDLAEGVAPSSMAALKKQLHRLANFKANASVKT